MPITRTSWIHATSMFFSFDPNPRFERIDRTANNIAIKARGGPFGAFRHQFHFAIPTPVIVFDRRLKLDAATVGFSTVNASSSIKSIEVWDGGNLRLRRDLSITGGPVTLERSDIPDNPSVGAGINIVVTVEFVGGAVGGEIRFYGAGADFI